MKTLLVVLVAVTLATVCSAKHKKKCHYKREGKWSDCDKGVQTLSKVLKEGSDESCEDKKSRTRPCVPGRKEKCKYKKGNWSECDEANNIQTRTMTLHKGGSNCASTKTKTRKCKKVVGCVYDYKEDYSECDKETKTQSRNLKKKRGGSECPDPLLDTITCDGKKHKRHGCKYIKGTWGECNPATKKMSRTLTLQHGGSHCMATKTREKRCKKVKKSGRKGTAKGKRDTPASSESLLTNTSSSALSSDSASVHSSSSPSSSVSSLSNPNNHFRSRSRKQSTNRKNNQKFAKVKNNRRSKKSRKGKTEPTLGGKQSISKKQGSSFESQTLTSLEKKTELQIQAMISTENGARANSVHTTLKSPTESQRKDSLVSDTKITDRYKDKPNKAKVKPNKSKDQQDQRSEVKDKPNKPNDETSVQKPSTDMSVSSQVATDATTTSSSGFFSSSKKSEPKNQPNKPQDHPDKPKSHPEKAKDQTDIPTTPSCKYKRGPWSQCDPVTNQMLRTMTLKRGNRDKCQPIKTVTRRCRRRAALSAAKIHSKCKYEFADWQQCNLRTNTMTRTMNLVQGDPEKCPPTKELKRKCRKPCKFRKGSWSACDPATHLMTRVDTLVKGDNVFCSSSRQITKKCKKGKRKCQYDIGDWSECDEATNERTRTKTLNKGDPKTCKATIQMKKACSRPNGKERCFFGKWAEYGPCMNGVMTKTRELIQGGTECERKAVKTKACS